MCLMWNLLEILPVLKFDKIHHFYNNLYLINTENQISYKNYSVIMIRSLNNITRQDLPFLKITDCVMLLTIKW